MHTAKFDINDRTDSSEYYIEFNEYQLIELLSDEARLIELLSDEARLIIGANYFHTYISYEALRHTLIVLLRANVCDMIRKRRNIKELDENEFAELVEFLVKRKYILGDTFEKICDEFEKGINNAI